MSMLRLIIIFLLCPCLVFVFDYYTGFVNSCLIPVNFEICPFSNHLPKKKMLKSFQEFDPIFSYHFWQFLLYAISRFVGILPGKIYIISAYPFFFPQCFLPLSVLTLQHLMSHCHLHCYFIIKLFRKNVLIYLFPPYSSPNPSQPSPYQLNSKPPPILFSITGPFLQYVQCNL